MNCLNRSVIVLWVAFLIQFIVAEESDEDEIVVRPHDGEQLPPNDKTADPSLIRSVILAGEPIIIISA